jgi:ArsR family transcriptional regulator
MAATGPHSQTSEHHLHQLAALFQQLSDPMRLTVLVGLAEHGEMTAADLCELVHGERTDVSHHLATMRLAGLIQCRRSGHYNVYRIASANLADLVERCFTVVANGPALDFRAFSLTFKRRRGAKAARGQR